MPRKCRVYRMPIAMRQTVAVTVTWFGMVHHVMVGHHITIRRDKKAGGFAGDHSSRGRNESFTPKF